MNSVQVAIDLKIQNLFGDDNCKSIKEFEKYFANINEQISIDDLGKGKR